MMLGRGRGIRTLDIQLPKLALYQAELYPDEGIDPSHKCCEGPHILGDETAIVNAYSYK